MSGVSDIHCRANSIEEASESLLFRATGTAMAILTTTTTVVAIATIINSVVLCIFKTNKRYNELNNKCTCLPNIVIVGYIPNLRCPYALVESSRLQFILRPPTYVMTNDLANIGLVFVELTTHNWQN